ncbi:sugar ABC transporter substrate-binding protein [Geodermatophilus sp. CPCC 206100]|uniref:sugar ABC transporter substrate-binding protein n=1 Tax=Geodermatophilus sp. CPCC 206100 TaxID=3020054 RepID=UPI003AFF89E7
MSVNSPARAGRSRLLAGGAAALALVLTAGCSGDGDSGGGGGGGADASGLVAEMQALIDEHSAQPEFEAPGPELDAGQVQGRTISVIAIDLRVPALAEVAESFQAVAEEVGITASVFDGQGNPTQVNQGITQAINNQADAIISLGLPVQIIADQIAAAKDAGIPVVDVINTPPDPDAPGQGSDPNVFGNVAPDSDLVGRLLGATAVVETDGQANVVIMNTSELTVSPVMVDGITGVLDQCEDCEYQETDTALVDWATELPGQAASVLRSSPDVNFMLPIYDGMALFASTGVRQAGSTGKVQMASFNGTAAALDLVADGDILVADPAQNNDWAAWAAMDQAMRGMLGMDPADPVLPIRYVGTDDLDGVDTSSQAAVNEALFGTGYQDGFRQLWGMV